ncbi:MAG: hypothetical protein Q7R52_02805 [archaeon]|nr:hypothetical protein [archaeon]
MDNIKLIKILNILNDNKSSEVLEKINFYKEGLNTLNNSNSLKKITISILADKLVSSDSNFKNLNKILNSQEKNIKKMIIKKIS